MSDAFPASEPSKALTVSQLNRGIKRLLEGHFDYIWVRGEISNFAAPASGHWYFSLKDEAAQVRCAMFRNRNQRLRFRPSQGEQVLLRARVSLYEGRGEFQLVVEHIEPAGVGALQRAFEALKASLAAEGLFDPARKQALPPYPAHIALLTSPTGAAIRDLLSVFKRRYPPLRLSVLPVPVQGAEAPEAICRALDLAQSLPDLDAIVLARGGGSLEDLQAFNDEAVARAIAACKMPVVSAVGHETDFTIADFVADERAPTPSAAAEMLSPDQGELLERIKGLRLALGRALGNQISLHWERLLGLRRRLRHPGERLRDQAQRLDELESRLQRGMARWLVAKRSQLGALAARLGALSPLATLGRGYAVISDGAGELVRSVKQLPPGSHFRARFKDGGLRAEVLDSDSG